jgi:hypothetical protein
MDLNAPPPGADRAPELLPAVLRPAVVRPLAPRSARPTDALGAMLHGSRSWNTVQTTVSRTVAVVSWLTLCLDVIAFFVTIAFVDETGFFAAVVTWHHNPFWPMFLTAFSTILLITVAANTRGLRSADLTWLRVWVGAAIVSLVAVAATLIALTALLVVVAIGVALLIGMMMAALD